MLPDLGRALKKSGIGPHVAVIADGKIGRTYLAPLQRHLRRHGFEGMSVRIPSGEGHKSLAVVQYLVGALLEAGIGRDGAIIALGGGVIGDLAGFVAATYQRGIAVVHLPTTLLAQVDSSIGGKVGVNHPRAKNMIGAFHQPVLVWADVRHLRTLPRRELISGLAEVIKCGIIRDAALFGWLERHLDDVVEGGTPALYHVVRRAASLKASVVSKDERDSGLRIILNHGHTVGHALEAAAGFRRLRHGEAVLLGMLAECIISVELGLLRASDFERIVALIARLPVPRPQLRISHILSHLRHDKKNLRGRTRFVLPTSIGRVRVIDHVPNELLVHAIRLALRSPSPVK